MKKIKFIKYCLIMTILFSGCNSFAEYTPCFDTCLGSFNQFAYEASEKRTQLELDALKEWEEKPTQPWQMEIALPKIQTDRTILSEVSGSRFHHEKQEIWIKRSTAGRIFDDDKETFVRYAIYYPATGEWDSVSAEIRDGEVIADNLYITSDGSVWASNSWNPIIEKINVPILSRFNEESSRFEFVEAVDGLANYDGIDQTEIVLDHNDVFWIFVPKDAIYSFNPATSEVKQHHALSDLITDIALTADNNFYILWRFTLSSASLKEDSIHFFNTWNNELHPIAIPKRWWPVFGDILVDHQGRLWGDSIGYRDLDGTWHLIYPNPAKHFFHRLILSDPLWENAHIIMESSNGWLWFKRYYGTNNDGIAWFDPESGEGCWFTTNESFMLVEDEQQVMWLATKEALYKFPLIE